MDGKQAKYKYEQKVVAASAVVDSGATEPCVLSSRDEQNGHQFMSSLSARAEQPL